MKIVGIVDASGYDHGINAREILIVSETREYDHLLKETDTIVSHNDHRV